MRERQAQEELWVSQNHITNLRFFLDKLRIIRFQESSFDSRVWITKYMV